MTMGLAEETMAKLAQRHAAERSLVQDLTRRYERAGAAAAKARVAFEAADAQRVAVLAEWAASPGWAADRVAECVGLTPRELSDALRSAATGARQRGGATPDATSTQPRSTASRAATASARRESGPVAAWGRGGVQSVA